MISDWRLGYRFLDIQNDIQSLKNDTFPLTLDTRRWRADPASPVSKTDRILAIAERLLEIQREEATLRAELDKLTGEDAPARSARASKGDAGNLEDRCARVVNSDRKRVWNAKEVAALVKARPDSAASSLSRAATRHLIDRVARGSYCARGAKAKLKRKLGKG